MTLLQEILSWSQRDLAPWQRDAVRRLFLSVSGSLTAADVEDLTALLKAEYGIPDPAGRIPIPLAETHLPGSSVSGDPVVLREMRNLKNVNRILEHQVLQFCTTGMTIIYGGNGSGKSGYSRVLKRACRARDAEETVYADVTHPASAMRVPEAEFVVDVGGIPRILRWRQTDVTPPEELSRVAVFDARCARSYLDEEDDVAFLPYGLHVVESLGRDVMPAVAARLEAESAAISVETAPFADLVGPTVAGQLCATLSAATDLERIKAAGTLSPEESARLLELERVLAEPDPAAKAQSLRLAAQRLTDLTARLAEKARKVDDAAVARAKSMDDEAELSIGAQAQAAAVFSAADALLSGSGEGAWKELFLAAERFALESAYTGQPFPNDSEGTRCVLCQEPLPDTARKRMQRFADFVRQDVATRATAKMGERRQYEQELQKASLDIGLSDALAQELRSLDVVLLEKVAGEATALEERRAAIVAAFHHHDWTLDPWGESEATNALNARREAIVQEAADLEKLSDPEARKQLTGIHAELAARDKLRARLVPVLDLVSRMRAKAALVKCRDAIKTRPISDKAKDLASSQVTGTLKSALEREFAALGSAAIRTRIKERAVQGKTKHKLVLDLARSVDLSLVLSEGEQRALALGAFLAELGMAGHTEGIIFDDPVSSLDHHRRRYVARRLVEEAAKRQVVVLTHDTVFLGELRALLEQNGTPHLVHHLEWHSGQAGCIREGLPWDHMGYKERLHHLDVAQKRLAKTWGSYPNAEQIGEMRREYSRMRATIERVIEEVVLDGLIRRYNEYIDAGRLDGLAALPKVACEDIKRIYKKCHRITEAHDPASGAAAAVPTPTELRSDIEDVIRAVETIKAARKAAKI